MGLDVYLKAIRKTEVFSANITHNMKGLSDLLRNILMHVQKTQMQRQKSLDNPICNNGYWNEILKYIDRE